MNAKAGEKRKDGVSDTSGTIKKKKATIGNINGAPAPLEFLTKISSPETLESGLPATKERKYLAAQQSASADDGAGGDVSSLSADIESDIRREVEMIKTPTTQSPFAAVKLDVQCGGWYYGYFPMILLRGLVLFFKLRKPLDPIRFVQETCRNALAHPREKRSRFVKRLTPMTLMGRATEKGLEQIAKEVLAPHFHQQDGAAKKFAVRPTIRNHGTLKRDAVINIVAASVGPGHHVDLKNYDLIILVEIYKNICGMSVVGNDYEELKRYNLAEIYDPTKKPTLTETTDQAEEAKPVSER
ncbi:MAG: hypothetical protein M1825_003506 [Sarcosagium campestre]|nr:MAG: hypothetical protein M1825_003506 [Sarcosagium campestre]